MYEERDHPQRRGQETISDNRDKREIPIEKTFGINTSTRFREHYRRAKPIIQERKGKERLERWAFSLYRNEFSVHGSKRRPKRGKNDLRQQ